MTRQLRRERCVPPARPAGVQLRETKVPAEHEHLAELRASLEAMQTRSGDDRVLPEAVRLLLRVAIAHHESVGLGIPPEETPAFMEAGEPVLVPSLETSGPREG